MNFKTQWRTRVFAILLLDVIGAFSIFSLFYFARTGYLTNNILTPELWLMIATLVCTLILFGTYSRPPSDYDVTPELPVKTFFISVIGGTVCIFWVYLLGPTAFNQYLGRGVLPASIIVFGIWATLIRFLINSLSHNSEKKLNILLLGFSGKSTAFLKELKNHSQVRKVYIASNENLNLDFSTYPNVKDVNKIGPQVLKKKWHSIVLDPSLETTTDLVEDLVKARLRGTPIYSTPDFFEIYWHKIPVNLIKSAWFIQPHGFALLNEPLSKRSKRCLDIIFSITLLIVSIPFILILTVFIKMDSPGPVFFSQRRIGLNGKPFRIFKLRTMQVNAEEKGAQWAALNDSRTTRVGKFLRKSRLDELPQCWNILKGEMSIIGPRPERPEFTKELSKELPYYDLRHLVKPGLSGWAQVKFSYGASKQDALEKLQYDLFYIKNHSFLLDLNIALRTIMTVFRRSGR